MALSTREVFLILRARDEASRVLRGFGDNMKKLDKETLKTVQAQQAHGQALSSVGIGLIAAGAAVTSFFNSTINAANEYTRQAALTKTQTDKVKVSIEELKDIGREVGMTMPTDFDKVQASLYDIFSSIDVNLPQAKKLLKEFAMESVAGQEDLQEAGKGTVGILNAFKIPITEVRTVSDTMFQLVRKGVGTYQQFNRTIGRAVPSAARAGQSFQSLAGMMAFLTRNGISAAMASASAGRALDAISNEKVVGRLEKMGIKVRDAAGEFMPMNKIMTQLGEKLKDLTGPERAAALNDLFKGAGGTIQARRFFDLAVKNYAQLNQYTDAMINSKGAMQEAYDTMFKQPQSQAVLLSNNFKILKTEIGDALVPAWLQMTGAIIKVLQWFNKMDPHTRKLIVKLAALAAGITILVGIILTAAGAFLLLMAALTTAGVALGTFLAVVGIVVAAIIAIGVAIYLVVKYHKEIWAWMKKVWGAAVQLFYKVKDAIVNALIGPFNEVVDVIQVVWKYIQDGASVVAGWGQTVGRWAVIAGQYLRDKFGGPVKEIGGWFVDAGQYIAKWAQQVGGWFADAGKYIFDAGKKIYKALQDTVGTIIPIIVNGAKGAWDGIRPALTAIWNALVKGAQLFWKGVQPALEAFKAAWPTIRNLLDKAVDTIISTLMGMAKVIKAVVEFFGKALLSMATPIKYIVQFIGKYLISALIGLVDIIKFIAPYIAQFLVKAIYVAIAGFKVLASIVSKIIPPIMEMIGKVIGNIINILRGLVTFVLGVFTGDWKKAWDGIKTIVSNIFALIYNIFKGAAKTIAGIFVGFVKGLVNAAKWLYDKLVGHSIFPDLVKAILYWIKWIANFGPKAFKLLLDAIVKLATQVFNAIVTLAKKMPTPFIKAGTWLLQAGKNFIQGLWNGIKVIWTALQTWVKGAIEWLRGKKGIFGSAGIWLLQAGKNVIAGFKNGMIVIWNDVVKWVSGIATWIKTHKGPISLDGKLLIPAGKAIMSGFLKGLQSGAGPAWNFVKSVGGKTKEAVAATFGWIKGVGWPSIKNAAEGIVIGGQGQKAPTSLSGIQALVRTVASQRGWGMGAEWDALYQLVMHESGFNPNAQNPTSTAYGLFQFLNSTWGAVGASKTSDPWAQTLAGLKYIAMSYGDPINAWNKWQSRSPHWYGQGGWINEPVLGVGMRSGHSYGFGERGREYVSTEKDVASKGGVTVPIVINTQEIDPVKHAADLGWEIARRVS